MRYQDVLLLYPSYQGSFYEEPQPTPPVGLGYLAESLKENGIECSVIDMTLGYTAENVIQYIKDRGIQLVGVSMMSFRYRTTYQLLQEIRQHCPAVALVIGGAHASSWRQQVLEDCPAVDIAVVGEGEYTVVELCQGRSPGDIKGLVFRDGNHIIYTGSRSFIAQLDNIPFPRYEQFELGKYREIAVSTSRGCPYGCIYCQSHLVLGKKWRAKSAVKIVDELEYWYKRGCRHINIIEDNFALSKDRVHDICDVIDRAGMEGIRLNVGGLRADTLDRNLLKRMKDVGFFALGFGVEAGNDNILRILKKGETIQSIENAIENACDLGFQVKLYFIIGSPYETWEDYQDSLKVAEKYPVDQVNFYSMMPIPHTELFDWVEREGTLLKSPGVYLNQDTPWSREPFFHGPGMSVNEKRKALELGLRTQRKIAARKILGKKFGTAGTMLAEVIHGYNTFYRLVYGSNGFRHFLRRLLTSSNPQKDPRGPLRQYPSLQSGQNE